MLDSIYMQVLDMSKTASIVILVVIMARLLLKRAPKVFSYALWAVVLFRLLCPVTFEAPVSIVPEMTSVSQDYTLSEESISVFGAGEAAYQAVGDALNGSLGLQHIRTTEIDEIGMTRYVTADWRNVWILFGQYVWVAGISAMLLYSAASYLKIRKKLSVVVLLRDNIFIADDIKSPFVVGLFRPKIYLPCNLGEKEQEYIILHEQNHIKRFDHIVKVLAFLALAIHWFNPLVWVAFTLAGKDMEMSCDEAVIRKVGGDVRADYSASLLTLATGRRIIAGTPLAFGEGDTRGRIKNLASWKKPAFWVVLFSIVACGVLAICLLANPDGEGQHAPEPFCHSYRVEEILYNDIRYSFAYSTETAPRYQFTSDYVMLVSGDVLDDSGILEWVQQYGKFEEVKITTQNFDNYFDMSGWQISNDTWFKFRNSIDRAWRINVDNSDSNVFYYLIITKSDEVYLTYGYDIDNSNDHAEDGSHIRWLFKLARTDVVSCNAVSEGIDAFVELEYFPDHIDRDTDSWPIAQINESGTLLFHVDYDTNALIVSEDYYHQNGNEVEIEKDTYELERNEDGAFALDVSCRSSKEDSVNYFIKIKGKTAVYVMKIVFGTDEASLNLWNGELIPGTTYVSYQCLYMNPLSSYAAMGGDSGCKYIVGEDYFATINRSNGSFVSVTHPNLDTANIGLEGLQNMIDVSKWEWQEFPYTDEEWAALYKPTGFGNVDKISEYCDEMLYQHLTPSKFLLKMENSLWLVELASNDRMGTYLWSIYSLVPESAMGVAQWEHAPMLSSRCPYFRFEFDMDYTEISAVCTQSPLVDFDTPGYPSDTSLVFREGNALYWSPVDEDGNVVTAAIIHFIVHQDDATPYSGTIYIDGNSGSGGRRIYNATIVGTGLHLAPNTEVGGGVISAISVDSSSPTDTETAFEANFGGNTSFGQTLELTADFPYWCIEIENTGNASVLMGLEDKVYRVEAGTTETFCAEKKWSAGTYAVSFSGAGYNPMQGHAVCTRSAVPLPDSQNMSEIMVRHDLTTGDLEVPVEDLANYVFYTNSMQISVTVKGNDFEGNINLLDISQNNAQILQAKVNTRENDCLFTGLTSARLYCVACESLEGCIVVISGDK